MPGTGDARFGGAGPGQTAETNLLWYRRGVRIAKWVVVAAFVVVVVSGGVAGAASASSPPHDAAVDVYVEKIPTAVGAVPADESGVAAVSQGVGPAITHGKGHGGLIGLGLVLVAVTAAVVGARVRIGRRD